MDLGDIGASWSRVEGRDKGGECLLQNIVLFPTPPAHLLILQDWEREGGRRGGKEGRREGKEERKLVKTAQWGL